MLPEAARAACSKKRVGRGSYIIGENVGAENKSRRLIQAGRTFVFPRALYHHVPTHTDVRTGLLVVLTQPLEGRQIVKPFTGNIQKYEVVAIAYRH